MAICKQSVVFDKITKEKIDNQQEISFRVYTELNNCRVINTKRYVETSGATYSQFSKPKSLVECGGNACNQTGTLVLETKDDVAFATFYHKGNSTEYANGVITAYVKKVVDMPIKIKMTVSDTKTFANADVYEKEYTQSDVKNGYILTAFDLSSVPSEVKGNGWVANEKGTYIKYESDKAFGVSTIGIYTSVKDFEIEDVVKLSCLSDVGADISASALETTCFSGGYDTSTKTNPEFTFTGKALTPNFWKLNPFMTNGTAVKAGKNIVIETVIPENAKVVLPDAHIEGCGFITATISDGCDITDSKLERINIDIAPLETQFVAKENEDGLLELTFNEVMKGNTVKITYNQETDVIDRVYKDDTLDERHYAFTYTYKQSDKKEFIITANNVLITSFPEKLSTDESEFTFTAVVLKDSEGVRYHVQEIV